MVPSYITRYFFRKKICRIFTVILNFERLYLENELSFSKKNFTIASFSRLTTNLCKNLRKIFGLEWPFNAASTILNCNYAVLHNLISHFSRLSFSKRAIQSDDVARNLPTLFVYSFGAPRINSKLLFGT